MKLCISCTGRQGRTVRVSRARVRVRDNVTVSVSVSVITRVLAGSEV